MTIFKKILNKEIPAEIVYETEDVLCFKDINPQAPIHILIIPKQEIATLNQAAELKDQELAGLFLAVAVLAKKYQVEDSGYRIIINNGEDSGQEVPHVHLHFLAGKHLGRMLA